MDQVEDYYKNLFKATLPPSTAGLSLDETLAVIIAEQKRRKDDAKRVTREMMQLAVKEEKQVPEKNKVEQANKQQVVGGESKGAGDEPRQQQAIGKDKLVAEGSTAKEASNRWLQVKVNGGTKATTEQLLAMPVAKGKALVAPTPPPATKAKFEKSVKSRKSTK